MSDQKKILFVSSPLPPVHRPFDIERKQQDERRVKKNNNTEEQQPGAARLNPKLKMAES
jgi:hypothetical protein